MGCEISYAGHSQAHRRRGMLCKCSLALTAQVLSPFSCSRMAAKEAGAAKSAYGLLDPPSEANSTASFSEKQTSKFYQLGETLREEKKSNFSELNLSSS